MTRNKQKSNPGLLIDRVPLQSRQRETRNFQSAMMRHGARQFAGKAIESPPRI
jgi:hypothetical protein